MTEGPEREEPVVHDRRRVDPVTGQVRGTVPGETSAPAAPSSAATGEGTGPDVATAAEAAAPESATAAETTAAAEAAGAEPTDRLEAELAREIEERTADLQRLQAEYVNYRRRVERDRELVREQALVNVLTNLLPILDDIGRAREHGELEGGFKSVGEALEAVVEKLGLVHFGEPGEPFDPRVHEALMHEHSAEVREPTAVRILQPGYRFGDRVVRPARVSVADPEAPAPDSGQTETEDQTGPESG